MEEWTFYKYLDELSHKKRQEIYKNIHKYKIGLSNLPLDDDHNIEESNVDITKERVYKRIKTDKYCIIM